MLNEEVLTALAKLFVDGKGPSHDHLDQLIQRAGLRSGDPRAAGDTVIGKMKRVRAVLGHAIDTDPEKGVALVSMLVASAKAAGCFREASDQFAGREHVDALRHALRGVGYDLDPDGTLRPMLLESLEGAELTEALWAYVRRARTGASDAELVVGTAKNLEEAAARHVLKERTGSYPTHGNFPTLLGQAYALLGLKMSTVQLDSDPERAVQEALFLLAGAVNRLRNAKGDGHGRPEKSTTSALDARVTSQAAGLVADLLLTNLNPTRSGS